MRKNTATLYSIAFAILFGIGLPLTLSNQTWFLYQISWWSIGISACVGPVIFFGAREYIKHTRHCGIDGWELAKLIRKRLAYADVFVTIIVPSPNPNIQGTIHVNVIWEDGEETKVRGGIAHNQKIREKDLAETFLDLIVSTPIDPE